MENKNDGQDTPTTTESVAQAPVTPVPPVTPTAPSEAVTAADSKPTPVEPPPISTPKPLIDANDMGFLNDVSIALTIEIGRTQIKIRDLLNLTKDSIIDLNKGSSEPVDIYANGKMISRGHIITANGKYCVRLTSVAPPPTEKAE